MPDRKSGILLHITSLPSSYGIGDLGPSAYRFVDFLHSAKQQYWQVLPINPTDAFSGHSPYNSSSAFAGNTLLISPDLLIDSGMLRKGELKTNWNFPDDSVDFQSVSELKTGCLTAVFDRYKSDARVYRIHQRAFKNFCKEQAFWLDDYALFVTIKESLNGELWVRWPDGLKRRDPAALEEFTSVHKDVIEKTKFLQYLFFKQWKDLKVYCSKKGIHLFGDMSIYMSLDSVDVWAHPKNYKLGDDYQPLGVSGVPPDYFSKTGQRWGNPVYDWQALKNGGFSWWIERFKVNFLLFDTVRIDHFRGLVQFWEIPVKESTAVNGIWKDVPTDDFFKCLEDYFYKPLPIIAEDLGYITNDVREVMRRYNFMGMKVLLFAFKERDKQHPYLPHNYTERCLVYTGTHDNNTVTGWFMEEMEADEYDFFQKYIQKNVSKETVSWEMIRLALQSPAQIAMIPFQDLLSLGGEARMNKPATTQGNWCWRFREQVLHKDLVHQLSQLTLETSRA